MKQKRSPDGGGGGGTAGQTRRDRKRFHAASPNDRPDQPHDEYQHRLAVPKTYIQVPLIQLG